MNENKNSAEKAIDYEDIMGKAFNNFMRLFITPEVIKRQENDELSKPLDLRAAQIIFNPGSGYEVRINDEVRAVVKLRHEDLASKVFEDDVFENEIGKIEGIFLTETDDPNFGHATFLRFNNLWNMSFDFLYNKEFARKNIKTAVEFIEAAEFSYSKKNWASFIDNLFSATELLAKSKLLGHSDSEFQKKASHKAIKSKFNLDAKLGNVTPEIRETFNKLTQLRNPARYVKKDISITADEAKEMLDEVKNFLEVVRKLSEKEY